MTAPDLPSSARQPGGDTLQDKKLEVVYDEPGDALIVNGVVYSGAMFRNMARHGFELGTLFGIVQADSKRVIFKAFPLTRKLRRALGREV